MKFEENKIFANQFLIIDNNNNNSTRMIDDYRIIDARWI